MIHTYYTYSLAPPIALLTPVGLFALWQARGRLPVRLIGAAIVGSTAYMSYRIFLYSDGYPTWLRLCIPVVGLLTTAGWIVATKQPTQRV
ncbi:hypothetical protein, partial [Escherichia coli]|uniref:hypothetical protein n=1 Tax=Escherichia coli TaxID=562 RepID=UPI0032E80506